MQAAPRAKSQISGRCRGHQHQISGALRLSRCCPCPGLSTAESFELLLHQVPQFHDTGFDSEKDDSDGSS